MSSLRDRVSTAIRVFREDPDTVVMLSSGGPRGTGEWTAKYGVSEYTEDSEVDALASLWMSMKWVRDREFREWWNERAPEVVRDD